MTTSNTFNVSWHTQPLTILNKILLVFLIAATIAASCDNDNDYNDHDRVATHAERTLR